MRAERVVGRWQTIEVTRFNITAPSSCVIVATIKPRYLSTPHPLMIFCIRIRETDQIFVHFENKSMEADSTMTFKPGLSGNPHGNRHHSRHLLNQEFIQALLLHFRQHGKKAIEKVAREQPASYLKILGLLVPREHKVEHRNPVKELSDEQLEAAIEYIEAALAAKAGDQAKVSEGIAERAALPTPELEPQRKRSNRLLEYADTAVGPRERKPKKRSRGSAYRRLLAPDLTNLAVTMAVCGYRPAEAQRRARCHRLSGRNLSPPPQAVGRGFAKARVGCVVRISQMPH
jgi:hypothetical protein